MRLRVFLGFFFVLSALVTSAGCGPDDSIRDAREAQEREDFERKKRQLDPAVGVYHGQIINTVEKKNLAAILTIKHVTILSSQPGSSDVARIPSLGGDLVSLPDPENKNSIAMNIGDYTVGFFDPIKNEVSLWSQNSTDSGASIFSFNGKISGDFISGTITTRYKSGMIFEGRRE